jgi:DNA-binding FrmR family transcriptional regulator
MQQPKHALRVDAELKSKALPRLRRIEGQVRGIAQMIEDERYCPDILMQLSAVHESLRAVGQLLLRNHLEHCATDALRSKDPARAAQTYDEIPKLFYQHAR